MSNNKDLSKGEKKIKAEWRSREAKKAKENGTMRDINELRNIFK